jgi:hypothetical protein
VVGVRPLRRTIGGVLALPAVGVAMIGVGVVLIACAVFIVAAAFFVPAYFVIGGRKAFEQMDDELTPGYDPEELLEEMLRHPSDTIAVWDRTIRDALDI